MRKNQETKKNSKTINSKDFIQTVGKILECLPNGTFRVESEDGHELLAYLSGKMRMFKIKLLPGDKVKLEISPYDLHKARITYRL